MTETKARFTHVQTAIVTLRRGKHDPHWLEAAEYLIDHAAFDTKLLLEASIALEQTKNQSLTQDTNATTTKRLIFLAAACSLIALIEALLLWILWSSQCS